MASSALTDAAAASAGLVLFAWCAHQRVPWAFAAAAGLLVTGVAIGRSLRRAASPSNLLGLDYRSGRTWLYALAGAGLGAAGGALHRNALGLTPFADAVRPFVIVACLIGAMEELVYRGWLFGRLLAWGRPAAVIGAAIAHAAYKMALFAWVPAVPGVDLPSLALWTMAAGLVLGATRAITGSVVPAVAAHIAFDFVVYGAAGEAPWWVWR